MVLQNVQFILFGVNAHYQSDLLPERDPRAGRNPASNNCESLSCSMVEIYCIREQENRIKNIGTKTRKSKMAPTDMESAVTNLSVFVCILVDFY